MRHPALWCGPWDEPDRYAVLSATVPGSEGVLYRGRLDVGGLRVNVALKALHPTHLATIDAWEHRWHDQLELLRCVQARGLVGVREGFRGPVPHAAGNSAECDETLYLVMNWVDGPTLEGWLVHHAIDDDTSKIVLLAQIADALDLMHSGDVTGGVPVVHGDVKPANIVVAPHGAVLVDPGCVRVVGAPAGAVDGTVGYIAPEALDGPIGAPADRYAFGGVAFYLLTGERPPVLGPARHELVSALVDAHVDPGVVGHVLTLLDADPRRRPDSLSAWIAELERYRQRSGRYGITRPFAPSRNPPPPV